MSPSPPPGLGRVGAGFFHTPTLASGELQSGQATNVVRAQPRWRTPPPSRGQHRRPGPARFDHDGGKPPRLGLPSRQGGRLLPRDRPSHPECLTASGRPVLADACVARPSFVLNGHADPPLPFLWCRELSSIIGVKPGDPDTENSPSDPARLLLLAVSRPKDALVAARTVLAGQPSSYDASLAHHAIGIVLAIAGISRERSQS